MAELRACKKCQLVSENVTLYHHETKWLGGSEYLCVTCQTHAFHFWIKLMVIAVLGYDDEVKKAEGIKEMGLRAIALAQKNKITEDYCMKAVLHEVKLATGST